MQFKEYRFSDLLKEIVDNRGKTCPVQEQGMPLIATNCIKNESLYPVFEKLRYVSDETYLNWFRAHPEPSDIIFVCKGSPGRVAWTPKPVTFCIAQDMVAIRADETKVDPKYLFALLRSQETQNKILNMHVGSLIPHFKKGDFKNFYLSVPEDMDYQKKAGEIYFKFCEKIEVNTQASQTLESFAQAIFKSWFVDFDPVKAKIEALAAGGNADDAELAAMSAISAKTIDELNGLKANNPKAFNKLAQTAALFPAAMQDSELGEIPEGWSVSSLSELIKITGGGTPKRSEELYWNGNIPWFSVKDVPTEGNVFVVDTDEKITELGLNKSSTKLLPKGTTIITARGTVGKLALVGTDMCMNQSCYGVRGKNVGDFYNYFNLKEAVSTLQRNTHGAVFDTITTQTFDTYSLAFSGVELANKFDALVAPLLQNIETNVRQNIELATLRDTLLPKLLSGEIDLTSEVVA